MNPEPSSSPDFSLVAGGPTHRIQEKLGLVRPGWIPVLNRAALSTLVTWFVLLGLSAAQGLAIGTGVRIPFLYDFAGYARFLIAIPLLILAEGPIEREIDAAAAHFGRSGLISEVDRPTYEVALDHANSMRDSTLAEVVLLVLAGVSAILARREFPFDFSTWRSFVSPSGHTRTLAGWWYLVVGVGLFQFLVWRWLWRLFIWYRFLRRMAKLELRLIPTHPDRAGGLRFVGDAQRLFSIIVSAFSLTMDGVLGDEIVYAGVPLASFKFGIAGYVLLVPAIFLLPLTTFAAQMRRDKRKSLLDYSAFAVVHNRLFDQKWVQGDNPKGDGPLGAPDISSLADLGGASEVLYRMKPIPFGPADVLVFGLAALIPLIPLGLAVFPAKEILDLIVKVLA